jgi:hypothetical protein
MGVCYGFVRATDKDIQEAREAIQGSLFLAKLAAEKLGTVHDHDAMILSTAHPHLLWAIDALERSHDALQKRIASSD